MKTQSPPPKITNPVAVASNESELNEIPDTELSITIVRMFKTQTARGKMDNDRQCENDSTKRDAEENLVWWTRNEKEREKKTSPWKVSMI